MLLNAYLSFRFFFEVFLKIDFYSGVERKNRKNEKRNGYFKIIVRKEFFKFILWMLFPGIRQGGAFLTFYG